MDAPCRATSSVAVLGLVTALLSCSPHTSRTITPAVEPAAEAGRAQAPVPGVGIMETLPPVTEVMPPRRLPTGAPPQVPYVDDATIVFPDGRQILLQRPPKQFSDDIAGESYGSVVRVRAGWIGSTYDFMQDVLTFHEIDGSFRRRVAGSGPAAVSTDGRRVLVSNGTWNTVLTSSRADVTSDVLDARPGAPRTGEEPVGFLGRRGREVVVNLTAMEDFRARGVLVTGGGAHLRGARGRACRCRFLPREDHQRHPPPWWACEGQHGLHPGRQPVFRAPGLELVSFSPDGTLAVGLPHRWRPRRLVIVSTETGEVRQHVDIAGPVTWEDNRHLLVVVARSDRSAIRSGLMRLSWNGVAEWALPMRDLDPLAGRPTYGPHPVVQPD